MSSKTYYVWVQKREALYELVLLTPADDLRSAPGKAIEERYSKQVDWLDRTLRFVVHEETDRRDAAMFVVRISTNIDVSWEPATLTPEMLSAARAHE